jgi:hypothetical protein
MPLPSCRLAPRSPAVAGAAPRSLGCSRGSPLAWLGIEGVVAIVAGVMAGSIALIAFGLDSAIEGVASVMIIWRFSGIPASLGAR